MRIQVRVLFLALSPGAVLAQVEQRPEEMLSVQIVCEKWGDETPRPAVEGESRSHYLVDHRIRWEVGPTPIGNVDVLKAALERIYDNKATWLPDRDDPGTLKPMPVVVEVGAGVCWQDVVRTWHVVSGARFREIRVGFREGERFPVRHENAPSSGLVLERVAARQVPAEILVPAAVFAEGAGPWSWRAELQITQAGALKQGDTTIYDPKRDKDDRNGVADFLKGLLDQARQKGEVVHEEVGGEVREVLAHPILVHVDKWAEYHYIQRLLEDCRRVEPPFRIVHVAVTEQDQEERQLRERGR